MGRSNKFNPQKEIRQDRGFNKRIHADKKNLQARRDALALRQGNYDPKKIQDEFNDDFDNDFDGE